MSDGEHLANRFGQNLRILREQKGIQQSDLAKRMWKIGRRWHQSTVSAAESGERTVSFDEACDLAKILKTSLDRFTWTTAEASETEMVYSAGARLRQCYDAVAESVERLLGQHGVAGRVLAQHEGSKYPRVQEARRDVACRMEEYGLDNAVGLGIYQYENRGQEEES